MAECSENAGTCNTLEELGKIVELVPEDRRAVAERLAEELTFMAQTLQDLRKSITERGPVELFKQGAQRFLRENPALKSYNTTIQRYSLLYKQLTDLLPKQVQAPPENPAQQFILEGMEDMV